MNNILYIIKEYWVFITFIFGVIGTFYVFAKAMIDATKCSLRNDILSIYDKCKDEKKITHYQLDALTHSADLYFKLKGNSFVKDVVKRVDEFDLVD